MPSRKRQALREPPTPQAPEQPSPWTQRGASTTTEPRRLIATNWWRISPDTCMPYRKGVSVHPMREASTDRIVSSGLVAGLQAQHKSRGQSPRLTASSANRRFPLKRSYGAACKPVFTSPRVVLMAVPSVPRAPMITTLTRAAISEYSIAVAPDSSLMNLQNICLSPSTSNRRQSNDDDFIIGIQFDCWK